MISTDAKELEEDTRLKLWIVRAFVMANQFV